MILDRLEPLSDKHHDTGKFSLLLPDISNVSLDVDPSLQMPSRVENDLSISILNTLVNLHHDFSPFNFSYLAYITEFLDAHLRMEALVLQPIDDVLEFRVYHLEIILLLYGVQAPELDAIWLNFVLQLRVDCKPNKTETRTGFQ